MRGTPETERWLYVRRKENEKFYHVRFEGSKGVLDLPEGEVLHYRWKESGNLAVGLDGGIQCARTFSDGEVLTRCFPRNTPGKTRRYSLQTEVKCLCLVLVSALFVRGVQVLHRPRAEPSKAAPIVLASGTVPPVAHPGAKTPIPKRTPKVKVSRRKKQRTRQNADQAKSRWHMLEKRARSAFIRGDLAAAVDFLARIQTMNEGRIPRKLAKFSAEVEYAQCQRAFSTKEWRSAVRACEAATRTTSHKRARKILGSLAAMARRFFLEGYVMEETNPEAAISRYKAVVRMAPSQSPYRRKAIGKLRALRGDKVD